MRDGGRGQPWQWGESSGRVNMVGRQQHSAATDAFLTSDRKQHSYVTGSSTALTWSPGCHRSTCEPAASTTPEHSNPRMGDAPARRNLHSGIRDEPPGILNVRSCVSGSHSLQTPLVDVLPPSHVQCWITSAISDAPTHLTKEMPFTAKISTTTLVTNSDGNTKQQLTFGRRV